MIYIVAEEGTLFSKENQMPIIMKSDLSSSNLDFLSDLIRIKEDNVDLQLDQVDGRIAREPNPQLYRKI